ncbi:hypothetical protein CNO14_05620 (plasmid) [Borrelia miyamotoi]|uniref:Uncharacterized protein n=2 Tax=Borrelia miyamotoi TaxID=47466 RepID=A0A481YFJ2_9SPIR|nr:hypothetical protein [Borrelia miyamotoi]MBW6185236.1 hypothetical protein [Pseudomonas aeruginosa]ATQ15453.1 hypothetical protein CNO14_05620 [Borrelia miyamotoi]ATQ19103.1 hypothetical protein CNO11_06075 [Borrelia miyamotoi]QBK62655.1 hypothetical protein EZU67_05825 [Borrelia miyamotoi]WDS47690.1 hypothetical protein EZU72_005675 [Borrelia miyamotoi]
MIVNVNLSGRIELPYIPDYMRKQGSDVESEDRAFIILEGIDYGFIEGVKAFQIELLQKLTLLNSSTSKEVDPRVALDVTNQQMEFVKKIWRDNVVGFGGLFDQAGNLVTKEMVQRDAILLQDMLSNLAVEINNMSDTLKVEGTVKKSN